MCTTNAIYWFLRLRLVIPPFDAATRHVMNLPDQMVQKIPNVMIYLKPWFAKMLQVLWVSISPLPNSILPKLHTFVSSLHGISKPKVGTVHCTRGSTETKSKTKSKQKSNIKKYIRKILREIWRGALGLFFLGYHLFGLYGDRRSDSPARQVASQPVRQPTRQQAQPDNKLSQPKQMPTRRIQHSHTITLCAAYVSDMFKSFFLPAVTDLWFSWMIYNKLSSGIANTHPSDKGKWHDSARAWRICSRRVFKLLRCIFFSTRAFS